MSVLNTFFIMFKTNTDEAVKNLDKVEKKMKDVKDESKKADEEVKTFGNNFSKAIDGIANVGAAFAAFNVIKNSVVGATEMNVQLSNMSMLSKQTAQDLNKVGMAASGAGGNLAGAIADIRALSMQASMNGRDLLPAPQAIDAIRNNLKGRSHSQKMRMLSQTPISDPGLMRMIMEEDDAKYMAMKSVGDSSNVTDKSLDTAMNNRRAGATLDESKRQAGSQVGDKTLPLINRLTNWASESPLGVLLAQTVGTGLGLKGAGALVGSMGGASAGIFGAGASLVGGAAVAGGSLLGGISLGKYLVDLAMDPDEREAMYVRQMTKDLIMPKAPLTKSKQTIFEMLKSEGLSDAAAFGMMSNIHHESGGDPRARGDGGRAHGLFQWHPSRREDILSATGIDVSTASEKEQIKAAVWEMKNGKTGFDFEKYNAMTNPAMAGQYFSKVFERPADRNGQALARGKTALSLSSQYAGFGGSGGMVKIDNIEINTQATDATGIASSLRDELTSQLGIIAANHDDGQQM